jgi:putative ABC transport system permease protein
MFKHYLATSWRSFMRFKTISLINIFGLSLGLACFVAAIGVYTYINNADRFLPNAARVVIILQKWTDPFANLKAPMMSQGSPALSKAMRQEFPDLPVAFVSGESNVPAVIEGKSTTVEITIADVDYLTIVDLPRTQNIMGNPLLEPNTAAITEEEALKLFGTTAVLGRTIRLRNALDVTITSVLKPLQQPSHMSGPYAAFGLEGVVITSATEQALTQAATGKLPKEMPLSLVWQTVRFGSATYALLPADGSLSAATLESRLKGIDARTGASPEHTKNEFRVASMGAAWLQVMNTNLFQGNTEISIGGMLLALAIAVLVVACANYANLAFAQARIRSKEIGLRRTIGASRPQVATQALVDALLHVCFAIAISLLLVVVFGSVLEAQTGFPLLKSVLGNLGFWAAIAAMTVTATIAVALYPAITLSRMQPAQAVRADTSMRKNSLGADLLLGTQFVSASVLVVVLLIVFRQESQLRSMALKPGSDVLVTLGSSVKRSGVDAEVWRNELLKNPAIKSVAWTTTPLWYNSYAGLFGLVPEGRSEIVNTNVAEVSYGFDATLELSIMAGRPFANEFGDAERREGAQQTVMIDESLARGLGFRNPSDAVGKTIKRGGYDASDPPVHIVGVVADRPMRLQPSLEFVGTLYIPAKFGAGQTVIRIDKSHVADGLVAIDTVYKKLAPTLPIDKEFADVAFAKVYQIYALIAAVLTTVAIVTLSIALLGAFAFVLFASNRRAHEIGVRKTLGASAKQIVVMLLRDFSRPIIVANILGWPLAYIAAQKYLSTFEQRIEITISPFLLGLVFTLLISSLAIGRQAWRAARLNPADVLRHE